MERVERIGINRGLPTMVSAKTRMFVICKYNKHRVNIGHHELTLFWCETSNYTPAPRRGRGVYCLTSVRSSVLPSVQDIFRHIFLSNYWWQKSDIWSQASYRYLISCRFCWFLYTFNIHLHMHIFHRILLSNYWWQESDIWSQASYMYAILWEAFLDPSDSYFLFADLVGFYTHWTYMHIFRHIFLSNYWWQRSDIWSQASYRYPIS